MTTEWKEVTDPEELFRLKREGWEIQYRYMNKEYWQPWISTWWQEDSFFRARPRQPKMKKVKLLAYIHETGLTHVREDSVAVVIPKSWIRQPHLDLEGEVPE